MVDKGGTFQMLNCTNFSLDIVTSEGEGEMCRGRPKLFPLIL